MNAAASDSLLETLQARFEAHMHRHAGLDWATVQARLAKAPAALKALAAMEDSGGEPDVVVLAGGSGSQELTFCDCAAESPAGRRSLCYDEDALNARKENRPQGSAAGMAAAIGITLLDEAAYAQLQQLGEFDLKTSSWLLAPPAMRSKGGAPFGDRRYGRVFTYHNGVQSYYASRGFRGLLRL